MALTKQEKKIIEYGKKQGKSKVQVVQALADYRSQESVKKYDIEHLGFWEGGQALSETGGDIKDTFLNVGKQLNKAGENIVTRDIRNPGEGVVGNIVGATADAFRGGARAFGEGVVGLAKTLVPQKVEDIVGGSVQKVGDAAGQTDVAQNIMQKYQTLPPEQKRQVDNILGFGEGLAEIGTGGLFSRLKTPVGNALSNTFRRLVPENVPVSSVDDLITKTETSLAQQTPRSTSAATATGPGRVDRVKLSSETPQAARTAAEGTAPQLSFKEKWIGIAPDIKKRIQGKQDLMREYFDVAHARNLDDTMPTPYEFGAQKVQSTVQQMEQLLNDTGGEIGQARRKLGTVRANVDQVNKIENAFRSELDKLNLKIRNGQIVQKAGTLDRVAAQNDIKVLNDLYNNLLRAKQNPNLTNLIDLRSVFDSKIKFAKRASEVSNSVDPVSRQVRKAIADEAAQLVGKTEAAKLAKYSEFMDAYGDLRAFTERKAGAEYLLRLVLSGRGREAREVINTIRQYTGTDLMDDATMMTIATDLIGNSRQQNLFRQEITKSGLDALALAAGNPAGASGLLSDLVKRRFFDSEQIFLDAAKKPKN